MSGDSKRQQLIRLLQARRAAAPVVPDTANADIAIIGLAGRYPGAGADGAVELPGGVSAIDSTAGLAAFWDNLEAGRDAIGEIPADRWDWRDPAFFEANKSHAVAAGKSYARWGGFLAGGIDRFDALLFGISPREAELMDPQERLFLEVAWHAVEDAGYRRDVLAGRKVGVFAGVMFGHYQMLESAQGIQNSSFGAIPNRISHVFDWRGPSLAIDTMCSSSLTALQLACDALRRGEIEMALAGGVNLIVHPGKYTLLSQGRFASTDGRCRAFGEGGDGYVPGEGAGAVLLKPLAAALADGDLIWGVIKGGALNHGGRSAGSGFTVPSPLAQAGVAIDALAAAGVDPASIGYVEAHGTGTSLGDPVEISGLTKAYGRRDALPVGSIKGNIGHLESAAGVAGLTKLLLQFRHGTLAPSLTNSPGGALNPEIDFDATPLRVQTTAAPWVGDQPRRAGISAFGAGGSNAHMIIEDAVAAAAEPATAGPVLIVLSAVGDERLSAYAALLKRFLRTHRPSLASLAHTLQVGREPMATRLAFVAADLAEVGARLDDFLAGRLERLATGEVDRRRTPGVAASRDLGELARAWAAGDEVDWASLHEAARPRRVRLPGYPMARQRHWLTPPAPKLAAAPAVLHPLIDRNVSTLEATAFARRFTAADRWVSDHRFRGVRLLPGVVSLELARAAATLAAPDRQVCAIRDVVWLRPLEVVDADVEARLVLTPAAGGAGFELCSTAADGAAVQHARGTVAFGAPEAAGPLVDLDAIRARCATRIPGEANYAALAGAGLDYGPTFRVIDDLWAGDDEALARFTLPPAAAAAGLTLHPSLLDGALQTLAALPTGSDAPALPFAIEAVTWTGASLPSAGYVHARRRADAPRIVDLTLVDEAGRPALRMRGVVVREVRLPAAASPPAVAAAAPAPADAAEPRLLDYLRDLVSAELKLSAGQLGVDDDFERYGLQSTQVMDMTETLEARFGRLPKTLFFEYRTLRELAGYLLSEHAEVVNQAGVADPPPPPVLTPVARPVTAAAPAVRADRDPRLVAAPQAGDIAVIGLAGRYPKAANLIEFWDNLRGGRDCIERVPADRWNAEDLPLTADGRSASGWGGFLDDIDRFDARFFGMAPREAELIDPQERLFLETVWQGLEDAALTRASLSGARVGVYVGVMHGLYQLYGPGQADGAPAPGSGYWSIANRASSFFNFRGPSLAVDSACSSSLSALHLACAALQCGEAEMAIAGGVNVASHPLKYLQLAQMKFTSSDGRCRSFGEGGDGYVPGEGVGVAVLKPLNRALADGDPIWGVIKGAAINHGGRTNGYTVPNPLAQAEAVTAALAAAGVDPASIDYVEAHGTGTALGDPIEIAGLNRALAGRPLASCPIGSVKSNIGHLESAAGIAGLTKVLLQLRHGELAASLHAETLNPAVAFEASPCFVQRALAPWPAPVGRPRRAGLSSFGAGGSNAHVVIEEAAPVPARPVPASGDPALVVLSARSEDRLRARAADLAQWLDHAGPHDLADIAYTLQVGREAMAERLALVVVDVADLRARLAAFASGAELGDWAWRSGADLRLPAEDARRRELTLMLARQSALDELGRHWAAGLDIPWAELHPQGSPRRISLPAYRFFGPRYWIPVAAGQAAPPPKPAPAQTPLMFAPVWAAVPAAPDRPNDGPARLVYRPSAGQAATGLLELLRTVAARRPPAPTDLVCLIRETPEEIALAGMLRAAALEIPHLRASSVIAPEAASEPELARIAEAEFASLGETVAEVRYRTAGREVRGWREIAPATPAALSDGATFLVTGGAGGLGLVFAHALARRHGARIALVGRSAADARIRGLLEDLKAVGGEAIYLAGDVGLRADVDRIAAATRARFGPIHGVLHSAGVIRDALLAGKTDADVAAVLAPKLDGARHLDAATAGDPLEVFALFSSLSAVAGNIGQTDYAYANRFLGAFAEAREARRARGERAGRSLAVDWPYWRDGGMRLDARALAGMERLGLSPLESEAGVEAFFAALGSDHPAVAAAAGDPATLRRLFGIAEAGQPGPMAGAPPAAGPITQRVRDLAAAILKVPADEIDDDESFLEYGFDSVSLGELSLAVGEAFDLTLSPAVFFELSSVAALADHLRDAHGVQPAPTIVALGASAPTPTGAVAVIGMAGVLPQSPDLETFWSHLAAGRDLTGEVPAERWAAEPGQRGGFIADVDKFDPRFFGLSAHEAERMDPQQRLFMQLVWSALEDAACPPSTLAGGRTALFVGVAAADYNELFHSQGQPISALTSTGMAHSILANRISYLLDLRGPSEPIDTACSASLVAIHRAVEALRGGGSDLAIAGGINLLLTPTLFTSFQQAGMLSPSGHCRPFDAAADGYVRGEGGGALILKRLDDALRDGDPIHAVIRGSATGHGGRAASLTAPSPEGQAAVLRAAWDAAGIDPATLGYIEAHGTGTPLGDPVEMNGLIKAFGAAGAPACGVGSVKANVGHLETAAGIAGVLKTILALRHRTLPATAQFTTANPQLPQDRGGLFVVDRTLPWPALRDAAGAILPRRAGVSSFGFGGVNAHVVLEEAPAEAQASPGSAGPSLVVLSAKTPAALRARGETLRAVLARADAPALRDVCHTLQIGRDAYAERFAAVADDLPRLISLLDAWLSDAPAQGRWMLGKAAKGQPATSSAAGLSEAARLWVAGGAVDWMARADRPVGRKIHLPTYPFARERYWVPTSAAPPVAVPATATPARLAAPVHVQPSVDRAGLRDRLRVLLAEVSGFPVETVEADTPFEELGFDSIMAKALNLRLEVIAADLPPSLPFECNTLQALTDHLAAHYPQALAPTRAPETPADMAAADVAPLDSASAGVPAQVRQAGAAQEPIAIIGLTGRYPQAPTLAAFWDNLRQGRDSVTEVPADRWDWRTYWSADPQDAEAGYIYGKWGGFLEDADRFDPFFFRLAPAEAELMDPQERLFLETAWSVMEDAGYPAASLPRGADRPKVGVFAGVTTLSHALWAAEQRRQGQMTAVGGLAWSVANRTSYLLDLTGPSLPVDTACSSSLTAIHMACDSLRRGECDLAVAGGVNLYTHPAKYLSLAQMRMISPTGRCHSFGDQADGFTPGEGVGAVLLKPLSLAQADGDHIHAVIVGSAVNHAGKTNGYTVPSAASQALVVAEALRSAGLQAGAVNYVETHGTGTSLGDPLEFDGLVRALDAPDAAPCVIGAVKSNIGHLESAAGIAGLTKLVLQMQHGEIAPTLHAEVINPAIRIDRTRFALATGGPWPPLIEAGRALPRRAGISSFGAGGANAHVIVEEYVRPPAPVAHEGPQLVVLSARDAEGLRAQARNLAAVCASPAAGLRLADVAFTLQVGRDAMVERLAVRADDLSDLSAALTGWLAGGPDPARLWTGRLGQADVAALFDDDDDMTPVVAAWAAKGRLDRLAAFWISGGAVDWAQLPQSRGARRIPLPTYPFAGERYPVAMVAGPLWPVGGVAPAPTTPPAASFRRRIAATDPVLADHVVSATPILPGAAILSLAAEAAAARAPAGIVRLADVTWITPVDAAAAADLTLSLTPDDGDLRFTVTAAASPGVDYATGRVMFAAPASAEPVAVAALVEALPDIVEGAALYRRFAANGLAYGPRYQGLRRIHYGPREALGVLELPQDPDGPLNPALLDAALQVVAVFGLGEAAAGPGLPACLDGMVVHRRPPAHCFAHARVLGKGRFDVTICDAHDRPCIELQGLTVRQAPMAADFCYAPQWRVAPAPAPVPQSADRQVLIVAPAATQGFAMALAAAHAHDQVATIAPSGVAWDAVQPRLGGYGRIYVLGASAAAPGEDELQTLARAEAEGAHPLLQLLGGLVREDPDPAPQVIVVTDRLYALDDAQPIHPWAAALPGLVRSAAKESPRLGLRSLDVDLADPAAWAEVAERVVREAGVAAGLGETEIMLRGADRYRLQLAPVSLPAGPAPWRQGGVYVIVGGAGGIGRALAEHLLEACQAKVALIGRRPPSELPAELRARLESAGDALAYVQGDGADPASLEAALSAVEARFGAINGVVHSALVLRDRTLRNLTAGELDLVLAPKTRRGSVALAQALAGRSLDFVLLFSSAQAVFGSPGQASYSAASSFQDAFGAYWARRAPYPVRVIDWGFWGEVGVVATDYYRTSLAAHGVGSIGTTEGLETIGRVLAGPHGRIAPLKASAALLADLGLIEDAAPRVVLAAKIPSLLDSLLSAALEDGA